MTYLLTDADSTTGQSGGALVSERGEVIGMYGYRLRDRTLGRSGIISRHPSASATDNSRRGPIRNWATGHPAKGRDASPRDGLGHLWAQSSYVIDELPGTVIDIEFAGDNDAVLTVKDPLGGELANLTSDKSGVVSTTITIEYDGPHFLFVAEPGIVRRQFHGEQQPSTDPPSRSRRRHGNTSRGRRTRAHRLSTGLRFLLHRPKRRRDY